MISFFQAIIMGLLQGLTELFPISSLGHSVLLPWLFGWHSILRSQDAGESFFLSFLVVLHVATALALLVFYRKTWARIIVGVVKSLVTHDLKEPDARLGWLLIAATIPAGIFGLVFEHWLRTQFAKPLSAMIFLIINGCILLTADHMVMRSKKTTGGHAVSTSTKAIAEHVTFKRALIIGVSQIGALFAGISRSGITMVGGLTSGLNHEDAARFSFLLATPIIFGAGLVKLPDFFSNLDAGVRGQIAAGGIAAFIAALVAVKFLDKYFANRRLRPFGIYCIVAGILCIIIGLAGRGFAG